MERIKSGIEGLDPLLGGGYPKGKGVLLTGPTGSGKTIFGIHFLHSNCASGKKGLLVLTRTRLDDLLQQASCLGLDLDPFINSGQLLVDNVFESRLKEAQNASRLGKGLELVEKDRIGTVKKLSLDVDVVVYDSLAALSKSWNCVGEEPLKKFDPLYNVLADYGCTSLFLMDDRAHRNMQGFADYLVFGKIELYYKEARQKGKLDRFMRVSKMRGMELFLDSVGFSITSEGVRIENF
ncbi:MAG: RAD55 family ATPase [Methanosarcinaceae archaeon]|nr:RAD55 family ATPase [Methanosarcinaceae archaeon]